MLSIPSTPLIARIVLLAGVLLAIFALLSLSHHPAYAQQANMLPTVERDYEEKGEDPVAAFTAMDPEEEDITWTLSGLDMDDFTIDGGVLTFKDGPPDFEDPKGGGPNATLNTYNVTVVVKAGDGDASTTTEQPVVVTVTNVEEDGEVSLSTLQPKQGVALEAMLTDTDNIIADSTTWQWARSLDVDGPWTEIKDAITATYEPRASDVGSYLRATATYSDGHGEDDPYTEDLDESEDTARMRSDNPVLMADYENTAPVFLDQDPDMEGIQNETATRSIAENSAPGTAIGDPVAATDIGVDGSQEVLTYTLTGDDASSFTINERTGQISVGTTLDYEDPTNTDHEYEVTVTATDPSGTANATITVTIEVDDVDEDPTVTAGDDDIDYAEDRTDAIATYTATDVEDDNASPGKELSWSVSGSHGSYFDIGINSGFLTFKSQPDFENPAGRSTVYRLTVVVTDSGGNTASRSVIVRLENVEEDGEVTLSNRQPEVGTRLIAELTDPDRPSSVTWKWQRGSTDIDSATSATYEPVADDVGNTLRAIASYTDGHGADKEAEAVSAYSVQAEDSNDPDPMFPDTETGARSIPENQTGNVGAPLEADDSDNLTYTMSGGRDDEVFTINEETGQISVKSGTELDHETQAIYSVQVTATDPSLDSDRITVTINVTNVDEDPSITAGDTDIDYAEDRTNAIATYVATDPEDDRASPRKQLTWSVTNPTIFSIEGGVLKFKSQPDFEAPGANVYNITVTVTDSNDTTDTRAVAVTVTNVDEDGEVTLPTLQPKEGIGIAATLTDPDGTISDTKWQWARSTNRTSWTDIEADATSEPPITSDMATYTPGPDDVGKYLRATATYIDGESEDTTDTKTAEEISANKVAMKDYENAAPVFPDQDPDMDVVDRNQKREIYENMAPGTGVGEPVTATDIGADGNQEVLIYTRAGTDESSFVIDRETGQISVAAGAELDYEKPADANRDNEYEVTVTATDPSGTASDAVTVTIKVKDVQEAPKLAGEMPTDDPVTEKDNHPELSSTPTLLPQDPAYTAVVAIYTATDDEDDGANPRKPLKWSLSGSDMGQFNFCDPSVDNTCADPADNSPVELRFKDSPDFEDPADSGGNNVYDVTVTVTDSRGRTDSVDVAVSVTNVEEDGKVTLSNRQPEVGVPIRAMLTDPDGGEKDVKWQWATAPANTEVDDENWDDIAGAKSASYTPVSGDIGKELRATATYRDSATEDNQFTPDDESEDTKAGPSDFPVKNTDSNNQAPVFPDQDDGTPGDQSDRATRYVTENTAPNNPVVINKDGTTTSADDPVAATDEVDDRGDNGDVLTYTLTGPDAGLFSVDQDDTSVSSATMGGQIRIGKGTKLNFETKSTYTVTVVATDPSLASDTIIVTINVLDVDEAPEIMKRGLAVSGDRSISYPERGTRNVATYTAAGADSAGATWSLSGDDAGDFRISLGGVLTFRATPDFENPRDQGGDNIYNVMVKASSGTITDTRNVTVTVTNVNEDGTVTLSSDQNEIKVGVTITAEVTDLDVVTQNTVTWQWARASSATASGTPISGAAAATYTPVEADVDSYLRATASYTDGHGPNKSEEAVTGDAVQALTTDVIGNNGVVTLLPTQPVVDEAVTASLTDPDSPVLASVTWQWARASSATATGTPISGATSATYTPVQADVGRYLRATVTYTDAQGPGQSASEATANAVDAATTTPIHKYDSNRDGSIQRDEVIAVITLFLFPPDPANRISRDDVLEVIGLHLFP